MSPKTVSYLAPTIKNNIRYGDPLSEQSEVEYSAKQAQIQPEILNFRSSTKLL
jgi:ATP-binding cassette subfamily B protein